MKDSPSTIRPVEVPRPKGSHLIEAYSPKLGRRLSFHSRAAFTLWLVIETDPKVCMFCERPGFIQSGGKSQLAQFWVQYAARQEILMLAATDDNVFAESPSEIQCIDTELSVRVVEFAELAAARIWTNNWERMLPLVSLSGCRV